MLRKHCLVVLILFFSCGSASKIPVDHDPVSSKTNTDEIVFVVFKIQKGTPKSKVEIVSTTKSIGKIKPETARPINGASSLSIEISQNGELIKMTTIEHPLYKNVEYPDDDNRYKSKQVELEEEEFFIRFQKKPGSAKIKVYETLKSNTKNEINTFTL